MRLRTKAMIAIAMVVLAGLAYMGVATLRHGFSAREEPSRLEEFLARHARKLATPAGAKEQKNPYPITAESLESARKHWVEHCATCHALEGSGDTVIGRNLYPKVPDMREANTQELSDGEIYYIISNGIRFTGMPASGNGDSPEEIWQLVSFIRRLPSLSPEELEVLGQLADRQSGGAAAEPHPDHH